MSLTKIVVDLILGLMTHSIPIPVNWEYSGESFSYSELLNFERTFNTDLNNDGKIGDTISEKLSEHNQ